MKTRWLAVTLLLFALGSAAVAQDYWIRADANINLRDTYSLDADVVEVVPAGTVLQVIGRFNRWLKIDRGGEVAWMADWVSYTRLTGADQTQSLSGTQGSGQTQSEIDNCCFVDRQCSVDADWVSGYWAFQNNQCPVAGQTRQQTGLQTTTTDNSQANNCCFTGWQCNSDADWARGHWAFQADHCDVPAGLIIEGPPSFLDRVKAALRFLEHRSPQWYGYAVSGLDKIRLVEGSGISSIRFRTKTWTVSADRFSLDATEAALVSIASAMVHEACHVHRYLAGQVSSGYTGEKACLQVQIEATATFDSGGGLVAGLQNILENIDDPEYQWWIDAVIF